MINFFKNLFILLSIPLWIINSFGGIVAFIWLIILGNYSFIIVGGIIILFLSSFVFGIAMLPSTGVQLLAMKMFEKKQKLIGIILMYIATIFLLAVFMFWTFYIYYVGIINIQIKSHIFPVLLWCFSISVGPIQYMASKEPRDSFGTNIMTLFVTLGCLLMTILMSFFQFSMIGAAYIYLGCMTICVNIMFYDAYDRIRL